MASDEEPVRLKTTKDLEQLRASLAGARSLSLSVEALPPGALDALVAAPLVELELHLRYALKTAALRKLLGARWPTLERLTVRFDSGELRDLVALLVAEGAPKLRHLALLEASFTDELCAALPSSPLLRQLETLDLSVPLIQDDGLEALEQHRHAFDHVTMFPGAEEAEAEASVIYDTGRVLRCMGHPERALRFFERSIAMEPDGVHHDLLEKGNALDDLGRHEEALACYEQSLAVEPGYYSAWFNKVNMLRELQRWDDALAALERAAALAQEEGDDEDEPTICQARGFILRKLGREDEARQALAAARERYAAQAEEDPDDPEARYQLACVAAIAGEHDAALAELERALAMSDSYADRARSDSDFESLRRDPRFEPLVAARPASKKPEPPAPAAPTGGVKPISYL